MIWGRCVCGGCLTDGHGHGKIAVSLELLFSPSQRWPTIQTVLTNHLLCLLWRRGGSAWTHMDLLENICPAKKQALRQTSSIPERHGLITTVKGSWNADICVYDFTLPQRVHVTAHPKERIQHTSIQLPAWLITGRQKCARRWPAAVAQARPIPAMSPRRTSSAPQPGIVPFEAQLTLKVQLRQGALWQSRGKYFRAAAYDWMTKRHTYRFARCAKGLKGN